MKITEIETTNLSKFKTSHKFNRYGEIETLQDYIDFFNYGKLKNCSIYILGNGSNTLFTSKEVNTLVLKNKLPPSIECISENEGLYQVSSTVMMNKFLNFCYKNSLESCYYLASVPATIGGALAMNAGRGKGFKKTIYDYVVSITYIEDGVLKTVEKKDLKLDYRKTMFTGIQTKLIVNAVFKFDKTEFEKSPIVDRIKWSKEFQDNTSPNCGSVFKESYPPILKLLKGFKWGSASYSSKTYNWVLNKSSNSKDVVRLINIAKILHKVIGKKASLEIIQVK